MRARKVLVLASEPMLAAFLGMLLELDAFEPVFSEPGERAEEALARVRPVLVILLDVELDAARSDLFFARAYRSGARVLLFGSTGEASAVGRSLAQERSVPYLQMPTSRETLSQVLADALRDLGRPRAAVDRRVAPRVFDADDGTFCLTDEAGQLWRVYDRRGTERRAHPDPSTEINYRAFVNEQGEERRYRPRGRQSLEISVDALLQQLAAASRAEDGTDD
jgi:hypothetical protein